MLHQNAGRKVLKEDLIDIKSLIDAYYNEIPSITESTQKVSFGTSGHRGSSLKKSFNETHIFAISQALVDYRKENNITGKLFIAKDTHALSEPAEISALRVFIANGLECVIAQANGYTPTPVLSFTIIEANKNTTILSDGVVITPSHNPPQDGGFKYNATNGGPSDVDATSVIEEKANNYIKNNLDGVKITDKETALSKTIQYDFITPYVKALPTIIDMKLLQKSTLKVGVDPLGGSGIEVYKKINEIYNLNIEIINDKVDKQFSFMSCDHDGKVRMDCSSPYAMNSLISLKNNYDLAFANDPDFDRHGIVTKDGLMNPNHYLSVAIYYLFTNRPTWSNTLKIGKTLVSSSMIDKVAESLGQEIYEVPVGFKWFVNGMSDSKLGFGGEESAGASFLRFDNTAFSTDKDGIILNLLAYEMSEKLQKSPSTIYKELENKFAKSYYNRTDATATPEQKIKLKKLSPTDIKSTLLAGDKITDIFTNAKGNNKPIGGLKVVTENGWFAARPSGTEDIYKIYAESFISTQHLELITEEAQSIIKEIF